ncbi:MAG: hypothetical protein HY317_02420 [Acidobacteria bacterium]|nr:hypothetical protein [Acidobacteriota bacterium]
MRNEQRPRSLLHVDLDPFFVSVERSQDPSLKGRPVIVGGGAGGGGIVAAASTEARSAGVRPGQSLAAAKRSCPDAVFRPGDLEAYARVSDEVTAILLAASRRVERPSTDEAYVDLTPEAPDPRSPVAAAERIKDEIQRRLGLDASLGLASSRLAARVASRWARPRGLLVVLPGYESSFLARQSLSAFPDLPPHLEDALTRAGLTTLGQVDAADDAALASLLGTVAAHRLKATVRGAEEEPVAVIAPPAHVQVDAVLRAKGSDRAALVGVLDGLAARARRRLLPFGLVAGLVIVEVRRAEAASRRSEPFVPGLEGEDDILQAVRHVAGPLLDPAPTVRGLVVRLGRLSRPDRQAPLFPEIAHTPLRHTSLR